MHGRASILRFIGGFLVVGFLAACAAAKATPPPAEPHTAFSPVEVKVDSDPDWLTAGFGSIWLKRPEGFVDRIDAAAPKLTATIRVHETGEQTCNGIAAGATGIWSCSIQDLVRIDPATNAVVQTVHAGRVPGQPRIPIAAGKLWILTGNGDSVVGVDEADGSMTSPVALPTACHDLGATADAVYAICERGDRVFRIDPKSGSVSAEATLTRPTCIDAAANGVWVTSDAGLHRLDPSSLTSVATIEGVGCGTRGAIRADPNGVWILAAQASSNAMTRVDAAGNNVVRVVTAPYTGGGDILADGGYVWAGGYQERIIVRLTIPTA